MALLHPDAYKEAADKWRKRKEVGGEKNLLAKLLFFTKILLRPKLPDSPRKTRFLPPPPLFSEGSLSPPKGQKSKNWGDRGETGREEGKNAERVRWSSCLLYYIFREVDERALFA